MKDFAVVGTDGDVGRVRDFYFDDQAWVVRYVFVETGNWLSGREVLISPIAIGPINWEKKRLPASVSKLQVEHSPDVDTHKPVSRQHELEYSAHFGYPYYWTGLGLWGDGLYPYMLLPIPGSAGVPESGRANANLQSTKGREDGDPHLRSCRAVVNYYIHATDGDIGHVQGILIDERTWALRYAIVNTSNWWLGHQVLIAPQWIETVSWNESKVSVNLTRQAIKDAPPYDPSAPLERSHEMAIYRHYGLRGYWAGD